MSYKYSILADYPIGFWGLDESSGTTALDYSGCENSGTYVGGLSSYNTNLISGYARSYKSTSTKSVFLSVENDYYGNSAAGGFGKKYYSDNDFTLEFWFYPSFNTDNKTAILADLDNNVGIFYENGNITFAVDSEEISYTVPHLGKSLHICAVYGSTFIAIYIDGNLELSKVLDNFEFTNEELNLKIGPTINSSDYFLINAAAVYRYALDDKKIKAHYNFIEPIPYIQISSPENGSIFYLQDTNISTQFKYLYPANNPWVNLLSEGLYFNSNRDRLEVLQTEDPEAKEITIEDFISLPLNIEMNSSKIEWAGTNGITVEASVDGITYQECSNGYQIPGYTSDDFDTDRRLYLRIIFSTTDASKYIPSLDTLSVIFYNDQIIYSSNSPDYIYSITEEVGVSNSELSVTKKSYPILSRDSRNGLNIPEGSGFNLQTAKDINAIEFIYTPDSLDSYGAFFYNTELLSYDGGLYNQSSYSESFDGGLYSTTSFTDSWNALSLNDGYPTTRYFWDDNGDIIKENISSIYVNGIDKTEESNIADVLNLKDINHVVINLGAPIKGKSTIHYSPDGSNSALYQNITLYKQGLSESDIIKHYQLYTGTNSILVEDSLLSISENEVNYYNNDWLVVQNV
jgi:hypothetical protein